MASSTSEPVPEVSSSTSPSVVRRHVHVGLGGAGSVVNGSTSADRARKRSARRRAKGKSTAAAGADDHGVLIKYGSLVLLVVQMVGLVMLMRYTRTQSAGSNNENLYLASTAVFVMEAMKFIICLGVIYYQVGTVTAFAHEVHQNLCNSPAELLKLSVPSFLYTVQNNLLYLALTNLDAATYQVCYQLKILTTAVFSAVLLSRKFSRTKWIAILILTIGVAIVETSGSGDEQSQGAGDESSREHLVGIIAVICAACTSGFSGVYFERIVKGSSTTLWIRNVQLGLPSVILAFAAVFYKDHQAVSERGFFHGYNRLVWLVVTVQAAGGLIVAIVVKYADNVLKTFAASFSIIISSFVSAILFDFRPNVQFVVGTLLVVFSTAMYSRPDRPKRRRRRQILLTTMQVTDSRRRVNASKV
mmetsp:Transcript_28723/g.63830  ORF Transcript_28723/g.63830 Transcript_28723/m.63830 type:complete len:416 (+) Transcript_28723:119-1366(+)